ncbi:GNAT family N-acetyltransferase [Salipiger mangrovisoli]|uniref:GNAT family N-acetyltransferase n=1 Tax=Salipiger mangrovisoli TaxID=2865933 RepID=A0ABR9X4L5_9RHOB|nr:GNAT family N-acetyltransferase [Salipiger mangrovisoli]MBE9638381.1 GNAT family N-acetyltransferase [Salipiger mangrovisoli]
MRDYRALKSFDEFIGDRRMDMQQGSLMVATLQGAVAGYAKVAPCDFLGWPLLSIVCVSPAARRQGIGRELVAAATSASRWLRLYTSTEASNFPMRALLRTCDAREIGCADDLNLSGEREIFFRLK